MKAIDCQEIFSFILIFSAYAENNLFDENYP